MSLRSPPLKHLRVPVVILPLPARPLATVSLGAAQPQNMGTENMSQLRNVNNGIFTVALTLTLVGYGAGQCSLPANILFSTCMIFSGITASLLHSQEHPVHALSPRHPHYLMLTTTEAFRQFVGGFSGGFVFEQFRQYPLHISTSL
ncbi:hypothetical protein FRB99_004216 [Tulasnella sp. 403]|nr:hypothetical protein FRB99_004216 [Tulasnella sp. 403]